MFAGMPYENSLVVLRMNDRSITTVGVILGIVFIIGAFNEFLMMGADSTGWKVLHGILGVTVSAFITCFSFVDKDTLVQKVKNA